MFLFAVQHGVEPAAGEEAEADGSNSEERVILLAEAEDERGEGEGSEGCDGEDVGRASV